MAVPTATDNVKVLLPLPGAAMLVGAKVAVSPFGSPLTHNAMAELNPFRPVVVRVILVDPPAEMLALAALEDREKLGGGVTVKLMV